jgi:hypothetical protein
MDRQVVRLDDVALLREGTQVDLSSPSQEQVRDVPAMDSQKLEQVLPCSGYPIRKSTGQSVFAAHRSLSQLTTLLSIYRRLFHNIPPGHYALLTYLIDLWVTQLSLL